MSDEQRLKRIQAVKDSFSKGFQRTSSTSIRSSHIGNYTYFCACSEIVHATVGRYCSVARDVIIGAGYHPADWLTTSPFTHVSDWSDAFGTSCLPFERYKKTTIKNDVWIGAKAVIISGVTIGNGAIIGAGAIITKDVPDYAIVGGVPGKVLRYRFSEEIIEKLLQLQWWDLEPYQMKGVTFSDTELAIQELTEIKTNIAKSPPSLPEQPDCLPEKSTGPRLTPSLFSKVKSLFFK